MRYPNRVSALREIDDAAPFEPVALERVTIERSGVEAHAYVLSPFVWRETACWRLVVRVVPKERDRRKKISSAYTGAGSDGTQFTLDPSPILQPSDADDSGGCEDPTVVTTGDGYAIFYSGWNEREGRGRLLVAAGSQLDHLRKLGRCFPDGDQTYPFSKEAALWRDSGGTWRMFFEYAGDGRSAIGRASAFDPNGPWTLADAPIDRRANAFDSAQLSTGSFVATPRGPVLFYNGCDEAERWRIGWALLDDTCERVIERCERPLFEMDRLEGGLRDIIFAASAVNGEDECSLYFTQADAVPYRLRMRMK